MGWGIVLGTAAKQALNTYDTLEENDRENTATGLKVNADKRAQAVADRESASAAATAAYNKTQANLLAGAGGDGGAPVVNPDPTAPVNADQPAVKSAIPSDASANGAAGAGQNVDPGSGPVAGPPAAIAKVQNQARDIAPTAATAPRGGLPVSRETSAALQAFRANPQAPGAYENYIAAKAADSAAAVTAQQMRQREINIAADSHTLDQRMVEDSQKNAATAAQRATGTLDGYKDASNDVAANDPRFVETSKRVLNDLQFTHSQMADGQKATWEQKPDGFHVTFTDAKTGKPLSSQVLGTIGDVRAAVQQTGMATDPANYPKIIASNTATKIANEIGGITQQTSKAQAGVDLAATQNKGTALDNVKSVVAAVQDPTGKSLLDPKSLADAREKAVETALLYPDAVEYEKKVPALDDEGKPMVDANGRQVMTTTKGNRLLDIIDYNAPKKTVTIPNEDPTKPGLPYSIDQAAAATVKKFPDVLKEAGYDPLRASASIRASLIAKGFDQRTVDWMMPQIVQAGTAQLQGTTAAIATPNGVAVKAQPGYVPSRNRGGGINPPETTRNRGGGLSTNRATGLPVN